MISKQSEKKNRTEIAVQLKYSMLCFPLSISSDKHCWQTFPTQGCTLNSILYRRPPHGSPARFPILTMSTTIHEMDHGALLDFSLCQSVTRFCPFCLLITWLSLPPPTLSSFLLSFLDYCNGLLAGCSAYPFCFSPMYFFSIEAKVRILKSGQDTPLVILTAPRMEAQFILALGLSRAFWLRVFPPSSL